MFDKNSIKILKLLSTEQKIDSAGAFKFLKITKSWFLRIAKQLEKSGLIKITKNNRRYIMEYSNEIYAQKLKELFLDHYSANYSGILQKNTILILELLLYEEKSVKDLIHITRLSEKTIRNIILKLRNRGLLHKNKSKYSFHGRTWQKLYDFIKAYRSRVKINGILLWQFEDEYIFSSIKEQPNYTITGFNVFDEYGVKIQTANYCYYNIKKKLSKEEILIHSLLQINEDPRTTAFCIIFLMKNKVNIKKIKQLARKYDVSLKLIKILETIESLKSKNPEKRFCINKTDLFAMLDLYGVKYVR